MLIGEFLSPVGDKNRVALPKTFREQLADQLVLTRGYEGCVIVIDLPRWQTLIDDINQSPLLNLNVRDTKRFLLGGAHEVSLDKQGRFVLPESLRSYAEIAEQISFIGVGEWLEIWDSNKWQTKLKDLAVNSADIADRLTKT